MIIVSQDKETIVNFDNIAHIFIEKGSETTIGYGKMSGCTETLGHYETEERAKEVLQEIARMYQANKVFKIAGEIAQEKIADILIKAEIEPFKYEMPEK